MQQDATGCANTRIMQHLASLEVVDQQCCVRLDGASGLFGSNRKQSELTDE